MGYKPSPRPSFDAPTVLRAADVVRHTWGDEEAGLVEDWIYVSSQLIHVIVFGLPPGGAFRHSESFRTVFAADELLHVLQGTLVLANPETGEIVRAEPGESVFFRRDTWHHGFSYGDDAAARARVLLPAAGDRHLRGLRADRPYLETSTYADDRVLGHLAGPVAPPSVPARSTCCGAPTPSSGSTSACSSGCSSAPSTSPSGRSTVPGGQCSRRGGPRG